MIERVYGQSYSAFLQDHIFTPLGMRDTSYDENSPTSPQHAIGYLSARHQPEYLDMSEFARRARSPPPSRTSTAGIALIAHRLVSQQTLDAMFTPAISCPAGGYALPSDRSYGYGWFIAAKAGQTLIYHLGHIDGFLTYNGFSRPDDITVVLLSNLETTAVLDDSLKLAEIART